MAATLYRFLIVIARKLIKLTITIGTTGQTVLVNNVACVIRAWCLRLRAYVYSSYIRSYRGYRTYVHTYVFAMRYPGAYDNTMFFLAKRRTRSARNWNRDEGKEEGPPGRKIYAHFQEERLLNLYECWQS